VLTAAAAASSLQADPGKPEEKASAPDAAVTEVHRALLQRRCCCAPATTCIDHAQAQAGCRHLLRLLPQSHPGAVASAGGQLRQLHACAAIGPSLLLLLTPARASCARRQELRRHLRSRQQLRSHPARQSQQQQ
jgi:hypothetical protein